MTRTVQAATVVAEPPSCTEVLVQGISFVGCTGGEGSKPGLWSLQNLCPVPPYVAGWDVDKAGSPDYSPLI